MSEFAIRSKRIVTPKGVKDGFVMINDGKIADVVSALPEGYFTRVVEVGDNVLMPAVIDPHVHINEPGRTEWEGFDTATKAAIAGGIGMMVDMPLNSSPVSTTVKAFEEKLVAAQTKLHTNVGFWGGIVPGNESEIEGLIEKGVLGFKAFLTHSGIDEFPNVTEEDLRKAMPIITKHNLPLLVHCELTTNDRPATTDVRSYKQYVASRPKEWEDNAIAMMLNLCEQYNCHVHIVHISSANSIEQIAKAKQRGLPVTVETAQHYLYFNAEDIPDGNTAFKCAPPIREKANNEQLWQALKAGVIDLVATDHSPAPPSMKCLETGDFTKAWGGIASIQFALPVLWTAAKRKGFAIHDVVKWLCENPAHLAGVSQSKGKIQQGYDADLAVLDAEGTFVVMESMIEHRHKITPYLNETLDGVVEQTYLAGVQVYDNGNLLKPNQGKVVLK